jgi:hypothetical protein
MMRLNPQEPAVSRLVAGLEAYPWARADIDYVYPEMEHGPLVQNHARDARAA